MPLGRWATVKEAALHYGVSRQRIHQLMGIGALGLCRKVDGPRGSVWLIPHPFVRKKLKPGPKPVEKTV